MAGVESEDKMRSTDTIIETDPGFMRGDGGTVFGREIAPFIDGNPGFAPGGTGGISHEGFGGIEGWG